MPGLALVPGSRCVSSTFQPTETIATAHAAISATIIAVTIQSVLLPICTHWLTTVVKLYSKLGPKPATFPATMPMGL
jgi:hypothetical protein